MIQPPYLEDHTLVVHNLDNPLNLQKATLTSSEVFRDVQRWRDQIVSGGDSRKRLDQIYAQSFIRVPDGLEAPYGILFHLVPVWLNGFYWTRLLCTEPETIRHLEKHYSVTTRHENNLFHEV